MNDREFKQANLVFTGRLRDNKDKGLDTSMPRVALEKEDVEKLFKEYFPQAVADTVNTEILLHKVFFDIMYYTGRRGKEGLRDLSKTSFEVKTSANKKEFIEITFNEKTKKNQGDTMSAAANALHNDHHIITSIPDSQLCPVESFKRYVDLLHPKLPAFFQKPNKFKTGFNREAIGKNMLGSLMKDISEKAKLSKIYTNHQIRKTTATGMHKSGFTLEQISHVTKHKNLDSLKHYVAAPTIQEKEAYNEGLFSYGNNEAITSPTKRFHEPLQEPPAKRFVVENKENSEIIPKDLVIQPQNEVGNTPVPAANAKLQQSVVTNRLQQASNLFQNANFNNCNFNFSFPQ